jgi:hypothetical protein
MLHVDRLRCAHLNCGMPHAIRITVNKVAGDYAMSLTRMVALVFGAVYVLVGILGFLGDPIVSAATHENMESASGDLLGLFPINILHNIVHLAIGAFLLWGATEHDRAVLAARTVGAVYLVVGLLGFVAPDTFGLMPIGGNDIWLHLATAAVLFGVTFLDTDTDRRSSAETTAR